MLLTCVYRFGELLGSAVLVFILDTIVISTLESDVKMPNLIMSILIAITLTILILAVFPVSGGHISPVISFSSALVGLISMTQAIIYITTQCLGAILSALALKAVVSSTIEQRFSLGGCTITVRDLYTNSWLVSLYIFSSPIYKDYTLIIHEYIHIINKLYIYYTFVCYF